MRKLDSFERKIIRSVAASRKENVNLIDFIKVGWSSGEFEVSGFRQTVQVYLKDPLDMTDVMNHLKSVLDLIKYLEVRDLISTWNHLPTEDNTQQCGSRDDKDTPYFLTDISVASELLTLSNKKIQLKASLYKLLDRNFKELTEWKLDRNLRIGIAAICTVFVFGGWSVYSNYQLLNKDVKGTVEKISMESGKTLDQQNRNAAILDSLNATSDVLREMVMNVDKNTSTINELDSLIKLQRRLLAAVYRNQKEMMISIKEVNKKINLTDTVSNN